MHDTTCELVRKMESDFRLGNTRLSNYVTHSMSQTLEQIYAYLNSTHISSKTDHNGDEKPFFNVVISAANIWFRATDIDRKDIKIRATKQEDWLDSLLATAKLQEWMTKARFGSFLNEWGRVLSRYGSAVVKFTKNSKGLHIRVVPWSSIICDAVDFASNPKIEVIELSEADLRARVKSHGYDEEMVEQLIGASKARENRDKSKKDNKSNYYRLYELHGLLPKKNLTGEDADKDEFVQQMHVVSFVEKRGSGRKKEYEDYTLISGEEEKDPYMITHLIKEDDRTLAIGAVEHLFETQWMQNNAVYHTKKQLELASKLLFQTADQSFMGRNAITDMDNGEVLVHQPDKPLTQINNNSHDITSWQNFAVQWKSLGNEITGVSESMMGVTPKSGTAWAQTEAVLQESHSLFELMTENKGLHIEDMMREWIIPYIKENELNNKDEIIATLKAHDLNKVDKRYIYNSAVKKFNEKAVDAAIKGEVLETSPEDIMRDVQSGMAELGNERSFIPSEEVPEQTWAEHFKDLEWKLEIDITGEQKNIMEQMTTLNTALQMVLNPAFESNTKAQMLVGKILELTGAMSPLEIASMPQGQTQQVGGVAPQPSVAPITNPVKL